MELVAGLLFGLVVWAGLLWGSIALLDRGNAHNRFPKALFWSAVNLVAFLLLQEVALFGIVLAIGYLVLLVKILTKHYELGILQTVGVVLLLMIAPYVLMPVFVAWAGESELRGLLVLFGLPALILGIWLYGRYVRVRPTTEDGLPQARVVKVAREPAEQPRVVRPVVPVAAAAVRAPTLTPQAPTEGGPKFLG